MADSYLLAYDIGTSGTKASLFSTSGKLITSNTQPYDVYFEKGGISEQNPDDWWQAVCKASRLLVKDIDVSQIKGISFSGQMMGVVLVDENGESIRRAIIWSDTRAKKEEEELIERLGFDRGYELIGHRISCSYSIPKLMWVKKHEPDIYNKAYKVLQAKDYIILKMTGQFVSDFSDASGTNGMDIKNLCWSPEIFDAADLDIDKMPELHNSTDIAGILNQEASQLTGIPEGVPVIVGGGDGPCATLGAGCIKDKQFYLTYGTSAWIGGTTKDLFLDEEKILFTFAHVIPGYYAPTGTMQAAGASYAYIKDTLCQDEIAIAKRENRSVYQVMDELVEESPIGANGLIYLPYPTGERSPRWNSIASASFMGITMKNTKGDYIRAVLEGVAMNMAIILKAHQKYADIDNLILTGGGAKGDVVARILADVLGCTMKRPDHVEEATSMAAAVLAGIGAGIFKDASEIDKFLKIEDVTEPIVENYEYYQKRIDIFNDCYSAMEGVYQELRG